jgi:aminoglycoside 3-N-acetyltransferase
MINRILSFHPLIEFFVRLIYLKFPLLNKLNMGRFIYKNSKYFDFDELFVRLDSMGVEKDAILIVHSSYDNLKNCLLEPNQIIDKLKDYISPNGTLAMNATRKFKRDNNGFLIYDTKKSRVNSGVIPAFFLKSLNVEVSSFPINSMVAYGRKAKEIVKNNLDCSNSSSCGDTSSWKFCLDNGAWVLGMGIDLTHSLTIIHVLEESNHDSWPIKDWFESKKFKIITNGISKEVEVMDRREVWGKLHFAERTLAKDLMKKGIIKVFYLGETRFELLNSKELYHFLKSKNKNAYPYFFINRKYFKSHN